MIVSSKIFLIAALGEGIFLRGLYASPEIRPLSSCQFALTGQPTIVEVYTNRRVEIHFITKKEDFFKYVTVTRAFSIYAWGTENLIVMTAMPEGWLESGHQNIIQAIATLYGGVPPLIAKGYVRNTRWSGPEILGVADSRPYSFYSLRDRTPSPEARRARQIFLLKTGVDVKIGENIY
jgi:hypothetical protein